MNGVPIGEAMPRTIDRGKRDEWSEGGVMGLLEVYGSRWQLRNRAKLKGSDWNDIALQVSDRCSALKTAVQCKNKIESMKKRYRSESADPAACSSWQFYAHMDGLLKGSPSGFKRQKPGNGEENLQENKNEDGSNTLPIDVNANHDNDNTTINGKKEVRGEEKDLRDDGSNTLPITLPIDVNADVNHDNDDTTNNGKKEGRGTDSNGSALRSKEGEIGNSINPLKRKKSFGSEIAESIKLLVSSILKIEQARLEMYKESERMRLEVEIKRGEMELNRTKIIANTQLKIAKLFMKRSMETSDNSESESLRPEMGITSRRNE